MLREDLIKIGIVDLLRSEQISVRSANCCQNARFDTLLDVVSYYEQEGSFSNIRNSGKKTCLELESLCENVLLTLSDDDSPYANFIRQEIVEDYLLTPEYDDKETMDLYQSFTSDQKRELNIKFQSLLQSYSVRTRNAILSISEDEFIMVYLCFQDEELLKIKNFGVRSLSEGIEFKQQLKADISKLASMSLEELERANKLDKYEGGSNNPFFISFFRSHNHYPMFRVVEHFFESNKCRELEILTNSFEVYHSREVISLDLLSKEYNLSRERVRQIRNEVFYKLFDIPNAPIKARAKEKDIYSIYDSLFEDKNDWLYLIEELGDFEVISQDTLVLHHCLKKESCSLSSKFALQLVANVMRDHYVLLDGFEVQREKIWENSYLIKSEYFTVFDFEKLRIDISRLLMNNEQDHLLDIEDYIANSACWLNYDFSRIDGLANIVRELLLHEFGLYSELDGSIKIPAAKERSLFGIVYEILQQNNAPMHLADIFVEFKKIYPTHRFASAKQLRPYILKHEGITHINRSSTYTLKEWSHIRTGTIRSAIIEFLEENNLPQTVDSITNYVIQYFSTNIKSIHSTMSSGKDFVQYNGSLFGLKSKEYPLHYEEVELQGLQRKSFEQRLLDFERYIVENGHYPFASSNDEIEVSLNRWWRLIIKGATKISDEQNIEVKRVLAQYASYETEKSKYEWFLNCNCLKRFLLENRRVPSALGDEKLLYGWLRRTKKDFQDYKLSEEQRNKYIELTKLI